MVVVHNNVGLKPKASPSVSRGPGASVSVSNSMTDELGTVLEAVRRAQAELAAYLGSPDRNAELTIAKLVGFLDRREVVAAARLLQPSAAKSLSAQPPDRELARAS
jgi:hypothetical protein